MLGSIRFLRRTDMSEDRLSDLSLGDLRFFEATLRLRTLKDAARECGVRKSAASRILARLREALGDPLFVRSNPHLIATPRAERLKPFVRRILSQTEALRPSEALSPTTIHRTFRIAAGVNAAYAFCMPVVERIAQLAPHARISIGFVPGNLVFQELERGTLDLAFMPVVPMPETMHTMTIAVNRLVTLVRAGHELLERAREGTLSPEAVNAYPRIEVTTALRLVERRRIQAETNRLYGPHLGGECVLRIPYLLPALDLLSRTDMTLTLSWRAAERLLSTDPRFAVLPLEEESPAYPVRIVWHERQEDDPESVWLRGLFRSALHREEDEALLSDLAVPLGIDAQ